MIIIDAEAVDRLLAYPDLVDILADGFRQGAITPLRHHHTMTYEDRPEATLLLMPAWTASRPGAATAGRHAGVKIVTVVPDNAARFGLPSIAGSYLLLSAENGTPLALIDGPKLTVWRTAAASALASRYLSRADARHLVMVGAGALAPYLIRAHASVRPIERVTIWNRTRANAERVASELSRATALTITVTDDLERAVREADIVSTATLSFDPLVLGAWLAPGLHIDCVGAFRPDMREIDNEAIRRARVWVDTMAGGLAEAGDVVQAIAAGVLDAGGVMGDLYGLTSGHAPVRADPAEITVFKSVGASIEDLFAAVHLVERASAQS